MLESAIQNGDCHMGPSLREQGQKRPLPLWMRWLIVFFALLLITINTIFWVIQGTQAIIPIAFLTALSTFFAFFQVFLSLFPASNHDSTKPSHSSQLVLDDKRISSVPRRNQSSPIQTQTNSPPLNTTIRPAIPTTSGEREKSLEVLLSKIKQLFDIAADEDIHIKAAERSLHDMREESSEEGKKLYRLRAVSLLREAYALYDSAIQRREGKFFDRIMPKEKKIELYCKASNTALLIAVIYQNEKLQKATNVWANNAKVHFEKYASLAEIAANNGINAIHITRGLSQFTPIPDSAFDKKDDFHRNRLREVPQQRQRFQELYQQLLSSN